MSHGARETNVGPQTESVPGGMRVPGIVLTGAHDALLVIDVQQDFLPGGTLAVPGGDEIIPIINRIVPLFGRWIFSRDWHPADHVSFSPRPQFHDGSWPPHCVQGTPGAAWCAELEMPMNAILVSKGDDIATDVYSDFRVERLDLAEFLRHRKVNRVFLTGLATEYCVRCTALDACASGFEVFLVEDAVRGLTPAGSATALSELEAAEVVRVRSGQLADSGERPPAAYDEHGNPVEHDD